MSRPNTQVSNPLFIASIIVAIFSTASIFKAPEEEWYHLLSSQPTSDNNELMALIHRETCSPTDSQWIDDPEVCCL